jgi:hypothetical protein
MTQFFVFVSDRSNLASLKISEDSVPYRESVPIIISMMCDLSNQLLE